MKKWKKTKWAEYTAALCAAVLFYMILAHLPGIFGAIGTFLGYISPVLWGVVIAYILIPLDRVFSEHLFRKVPAAPRKYLSVAFSWILVIALIILLLVALIPQLISTISTMVANLDTYSQTIQDLTAQLQEFAASHNVDLSGLTNLTDDLVANAVEYIKTNSAQILSASYDVGASIFNGVISCILAAYYMVGKDKIAGFFSGLFHALIRTEKRYESSAAFWRKCSRILSDFIGGDILDGLIVGTVNFLFMLIARMPAAVLISVIVGVTNLAPTFGPIVGAVIGAFILVWENPWYALAFLIFTIILQTIDGYVLKPRLFSATMGVPSVWILICIIVGGRIFGVTGVLLAIPFAAISDYIYENMVLTALKERKRRYAANHPGVQITGDPGSEARDRAAGGPENPGPDPAAPETAEADSGTPETVGTDSGSNAEASETARTDTGSDPDERESAGSGSLDEISGGIRASDSGSGSGPDGKLPE
ncbi:MAG: AI-2E family transporter [Lachnospiraceae bacterium]|jgi:predicted PurR-regulated permease PerM